MSSTNHLLFLHGALGAKQQMAPLQKALAETYQTHSINLPGHGGRSMAGDFSMDLFANAVVEYLSENDLSNVHIFGYSMGGYVALTLARRYPELVEKIITLGTKFDWTPETAAKEVKMLNPEKMEAKIPAFTGHLAKVHAPNDWKEVVRQSASLMTGLGAGRGLSEADLKAIRQKVLICVGSLDNMVGREESEAAARLLPNGQYRLIEGFQHPFERVDVGVLAGIVREEW